MATRIAIVDDEEQVCAALSVLVTRMGHAVECTANDGQEILDALEEGKEPDLILMDYRMPGMSGLEAAREVIRIRPRTKVVIFSADDSVRYEATKEGFTFLLKPVSSATLTRTISKVQSS